MGGLTQGLACLLVVIGCSARSERPRGPAPVYERPSLVLWDAEMRPTDQDPFGAVAESPWSDELEEAGTDAPATRSDWDGSAAPARGGALLLDGGNRPIHDYHE